MAKTGLIWAFPLTLLACFLFYGDWVRLDSSLLQLAAILSSAIFLAGFYSRVALWVKMAAGEGPDGASDVAYQLITRFFSSDCFLAARLYRRNRPRGIILLLTIWSFLTLFAGTLLTSLEYMLSLNLTSSRAFSLAMDIAGLLFLLAIAFYLVRRLVVKEAREISVMEDFVILSFFLIIALSGFMLEGARMAYMPDQGAAWSPVGLLVAKALSHCTSQQGLPGFKSALYTAHALMVFAFIAYVPFSKQFHMFSAQVVTYRAKKSAEERKRLMHE